MSPRVAVGKQFLYAVFSGKERPLKRSSMKAACSSSSIVNDIRYAAIPMRKKIRAFVKKHERRGIIDRIITLRAVIFDREIFSIPILQI